MMRTTILSTVAIALLGSVAILAQAQQQAEPRSRELLRRRKPERHRQSGRARRRRPDLPDAGPGDRRASRATHLAHLSEPGTAGHHACVNARDRIGAGPWYNVKGQLIASTVADLHGDQAGTRDRNNVQKATALDAKGTRFRVWDRLLAATSTTS
jgi:hypothetical protein